MTDIEHPFVVPRIVIEDYGDSQGPKEELETSNLKLNQDWKKNGRSQATARTMASKVGWRQVTGIDDPLPPEGEERDKVVLNLFLAEQYYLAKCRDAGVIIIPFLAVHILTKFNYSWGWLIIVLAITSTYYKNSMRRFRRNVYDDIQREFVKTRLASTYANAESALWLNILLDQFWMIYEPFLSTAIVASIDRVLNTNTPAFLDSLRLTTFTLGNKSPRIHNIRTFPKSADDVVMIDCSMSFTPNDISGMTEKEIDDWVAPYIMLNLRVGKGRAANAPPVRVSSLSLSALFRIRLQLMPAFPYVQLVDFCFLDKPIFDFELLPIGGTTFGFDIERTPDLRVFIHEAIHASLGPMMYDPNVFCFDVKEFFYGQPPDAAIGVVQVDLLSARLFKNTGIAYGTPDPYVSLSLNDGTELARTKYKSNTCNPVWMETKYLLTHSLRDVLKLSVYDYNDILKDKLMGSTTVQILQTQADTTQDVAVIPLSRDGKQRGELRFSFNYFPALKGGVADTSAFGIVRLTLHQAKELDRITPGWDDLNPLAKIYLNSSRTAALSTPRCRHTSNPVWEASYEFFCTNKDSDIIAIKVFGDADFFKD